jgi:hypothetical protein
MRTIRSGRLDISIWIIISRRLFYDIMSVWNNVFACVVTSYIVLGLIRGLSAIWMLGVRIFIRRDLIMDLIGVWRSSIMRGC